MSTSYMNYAEKLNLPMSPQWPSNPSTPTTPTTAPQSFAPSQSLYKAYSPYSPSPPPNSPQSPQPYTRYQGPAPVNQKLDAQQFAPYTPAIPVYETPSVLLASNSNASYSPTASSDDHSFATNSSSKLMSPWPDTQIYAPYVSPTSVNNKKLTPSTSQPNAADASPVTANDWPSAPSVLPTPVNNQSNVQSQVFSVSSQASAPHVSSPLRASNASSAPASSQADAAHLPPPSTNSSSSTSYAARYPAYEKSPLSMPSPPGTHNISSTLVNEKPSISTTSQPNAFYISSSQGVIQSYATHASSATTYNQPNFPYTAPSPTHEKPLTSQTPTLYTSSTRPINPLGIQSASSAPVTNQPNISYLASNPVHDKPPVPSASSSSIPHIPPPPPSNQLYASSSQDQKSHPTSFTSLLCTQNEPSALGIIQPNATFGFSVPASPIPVDTKTPLLPPPPSAVPPPPAYKPHDGYFTSRPALAQILTPPATKYDPPPMNQAIEPRAPPNQGLSSPKLTPTSGTAPAIPAYDPQYMNQPYVPVASSPSLASPPGVQSPYAPEARSTGVSTLQFPLPPAASAEVEGEMKSSWGKRLVGNMLITRGIRAGVTSVASSVKLPAMLSPWGDNNPITLPNVRRREVILLAGSPFGADAIVSGSPTFTGGLLVDAMRCVSKPVVDQAILDRIRFDEARMLRTTSVKSLQITIKHQLMGLDANLCFYGERSAPLTLLSCAKGWFCPYLYASGRTPSVPRSQNFAIAQCFGPFLHGKHDQHLPTPSQNDSSPVNPPSPLTADSALAQKVLAEGVATMSLCDPDPAHTSVNGHQRLIVFFAGISPWRTQAWSQARIPGQAKLMLHLINGCPALVIPVIAGGGVQGTPRQGAPICAWSAWTLAQMRSNVEYSSERHYEELFQFLESMVSVPDVEAWNLGGGSWGWRDVLAQGLRMMIKGAVATNETVDPKVLGVIDPERAGIVMFRY